MNEEEPRVSTENTEEKPKKTDSGCLGKIISAFVIAFVITFVMKLGIKMADMASDKVPMRRAKTSQTFDQMWNQHAKTFKDQWPFLKELLIKKIVENSKAHYAELGITLNDQDIEKLKSLMKPPLDQFDPERFFRDQKHLFLAKIGKSEDDLDKMLDSPKSPEELDKLKAEITMAVVDYSADLEKYLNENFKSIDEAYEKFAQYIAETKESSLTSDFLWKEIAKQLKESWQPEMDLSIVNIIAQTKVAFAQQGITLDSQDIEKLESLLKPIFYNIDIEKFVINNKRLLLSEFGTSEDGFYKMMLSSSSMSEKDLKALEKLSMKAFSVLAEKLYKEELEKPMEEAGYQFAVYIDQKLKNKSKK